MVDSIIEHGELSCNSTNVGTSYLMNIKKKVHQTFINNDKQAVMHILDVGVYGYRSFLRINIMERCEGETSTSVAPPLHPPQSTIDDN